MIDTDPRSLALRLLAYARRYAASIGWRVNDSALARGQGIEDLVQDAIASLYGGAPDRRWDAAKHPDPMEHLRSFVNSRLSTLARSYENRKVRSGVQTDAADPRANPESLYIEREDAEWRRRARDLVTTEILSDDDPLLLRLHDIFDDEEVDTPAKLAARLGVTVEDVKNAQKRLRRVWERVVKTMDAGMQNQEVRDG